MNFHMFWFTVIIAAGLFWVGCLAEQKLASPVARFAFVVGATLAAVPGILFAAYYTKLLGEPIWLYRFRAVEGTELTAAGIGLLAGFVHQARHHHPLLRRQFRTFTVPMIFALVMVVPYVKPIVKPLDGRQLQERWEDGVCIQSTASTCGPASAATIARALGKHVTEAELAHESLTCAGGTENWYLARALRKRGFHVEFQKLPPDASEFPTPAIAGVKLAQGTGHFIALIAKAGTNYLAGDPLTGKLVAPLSELQAEYKFTGFFLTLE
jgi:hypothetical protein